MSFGSIGAITSLIGASFQADAAQYAADAQANAARNATDAQMRMFSTLNAQGAPYRQSGVNALNELTNRLGIQGPAPAPTAPAAGAMVAGPDGSQLRVRTAGDGLSDQNGDVKLDPNSGQWVQLNQDDQTAAWTPVGGGNWTPPSSTPAAAAPSNADTGSLLHQFNANDLATNLSPSYGFMLGQGLGATANFLNATGGLNSGNTARGLINYAENYASTGYQQAFQNYTANQSNIFNRLADIAGLGQTQNQTTANAGTSLATGAANTMLAGGAAQASGAVGTANAISGGLSNAATWYTMPSMINAMRGTPASSQQGAVLGGE